MSANYKRLWRLKTRLEGSENNEIHDNEDESFQSQLSSSPDVVTNDDNVQDQSHDDLSFDYGSTGSSDEDLDINHNNGGPTLKEKLQEWACKHKCTRAELSDLLTILRENGHKDLPKDPRTLLKTPRVVETIEKCGGKYIYLGIGKGILRCLEEFSHLSERNIKLTVNADGLPLFKSTGMDLWPILGMFIYPHPFVISLYCGGGKPNNCEDFLRDLVEEYQFLKRNGLIFNDQHYTVSIWCMVCDAPARQFIKCIKGHTGYFTCERCIIKGERVENRTVFLSTSAPSRSDEVFDKFQYEDHQHLPSPLIGSGIKCVEHFPLDYMHLVCLGVVRRILQYLKSGPRICRLSSAQIKIISQRLQSYNSHMPSEFSMQPRGLDQFNRFKATEFRSFLLYYGCVVLNDVVQQPIYQHFLTLVVALRILLDENNLFRNEHLDYAERLLIYFVSHAPTHYSPTFNVYNTHSLIHLVDDSRRFNVCLDRLSTFPFENHLQILKNLVRNSTNPLVSVVKRISELENAGLKSAYKLIFTKTSKIKRDSWFLLENEEIGCIMEIQSNKRFLCEVYKLNIMDDYFDVPCSSSFIGIFLLRGHIKGKRKCIERSLFKRKMVSCLRRRKSTGNFIEQCQVSKLVLK